MTDTARLRELAGKATPGEWTSTRAKYPVDLEYDYSIDAPGAPVIAEVFGRDAKGGKPPAGANAAYIAAANPTAILSLLDELDASKARIAEGWQDIATAPKEEGAEVLLWDGLYRYLANRNGGEWWVLMEFTVTSATHWRPLPPPPHGDAK
jgi:hypothetical protein